MDRPLPHDVNAERSLLGACLIERDAILAVRYIVSVEDFYLEKHAWMYEAMITCIANRIPPDLSTVASELRRRGQLEHVGGLSYLGELAAEVPSAIHVEYYAKTVADAAAHRRLIELGGLIAAAGYDESRSLDDLHCEIEQRLNLHKRTTHAKGNTSEKVISAAAIYNAHYDEQPFTIEKILPSGTMLLTGKPKTRKSFLSLNLGWAVASGGKALGHFQAQRGDVLYIDLEMGERRIHKRLKAISPHREPPAGFRFISEWPRIWHGCEEWLHEYMEAYPFTRLIIVDTLIGIRPPRGRNDDPYEHDKSYTQTLTDFCHKYNISMWLVHHSRKAKGEDVTDDATGSVGLVGGVDNYGTLSRSAHEKDGGLLRLVGRDIELDDDLNLKWDNQLVQWNYVTDDYSITPERRQVLKLIGDRPGLNPQAIAIVLGRNEDQTRRLLHDMRKAGLVASENGKYYTNEPDETLTA